VRTVGLELPELPVHGPRIESHYPRYGRYWDSAVRILDGDGNGLVNSWLCYCTVSEVGYGFELDYTVVLIRGLTH
jgi:hypothetical protein